MSSLYTKRFLDFGIRREKEVDEDDGWNEQGEESICPLNQLDIAAVETCRKLITAYLQDAALRPMLTAFTIMMDSHFRGLLSIINTRRAPVLAQHPPAVSPARHRSILRRVPKYINASFQIISSKLPSQHRNDAVRLRQPLLRYIQSSPQTIHYQNLTVFAVSILLVNAVAVLSEDRFLARSRPPVDCVLRDGGSNREQLAGGTHPPNQPLGDPTMPRA